MKDLYEEISPPSFNCPITRELMRDPVTTSDGHSYEREAIVQWLESSKTSPVTGLPLVSTQLNTNFALKNSIEEWAATLFHIVQTRHLELDPQPVVSEAHQERFNATWSKGSIHSLAKPRVVSVLEIASKSFVASMTALARLRGNLNLVRVLGICPSVRTGYEYLVTETHMNLAVFLASFNHTSDWRMSTKHHATVLHQISTAMCDITREGLVHRDLRPETVLMYKYDAEDESKTLVKVGWYGLTGIAVRVKNIDTGLVSVSNAVRYMAPEVFFQREHDSTHVYTDKSDVWSLGILGWRIFSYRPTPYEDHDTDERVEEYVLTGGRLLRPANSNKKLWAITKSCWATNPRDRPQFEMLASAFVAFESVRFRYMPPDQEPEFIPQPTEPIAFATHHPTYSVGTRVDEVTDVTHADSKSKEQKRTGHDGASTERKTCYKQNVGVGLFGWKSNTSLDNPEGQDNYDIINDRYNDDDIDFYPTKPSTEAKGAVALNQEQPHSDDATSQTFSNAPLTNDYFTPSRLPLHRHLSTEIIPDNGTPQSTSNDIPPNLDIETPPPRPPPPSSDNGISLLDPVVSIQETRTSQDHDGNAPPLPPKPQSYRGTRLHNQHQPAESPQTTEMLQSQDASISHDLRRLPRFDSDILIDLATQKPPKGADFIALPNETSVGIQRELSAESSALVLAATVLPPPSALSDDLHQNLGDPESRESSDQHASVISPSPVMDYNDTPHIHDMSFESIDSPEPSAGKRYPRRRPRSASVVQRVRMAKIIGRMSKSEREAFYIAQSMETYEAEQEKRDAEEIVGQFSSLNTSSEAFSSHTSIWNSNKSEEASVLVPYSDLDFEDGTSLQSTSNPVIHGEYAYDNLDIIGEQLRESNIPAQSPISTSLQYTRSHDPNVNRPPKPQPKSPASMRRWMPKNKDE